MARVVRGQVLSLKSQPFMEAARAVGVGWFGQFRRHLLPNLAALADRVVQVHLAAVERLATRPAEPPAPPWP